MAKYSYITMHSVPEMLLTQGSQPLKILLELCLFAAKEMEAGSRHMVWVLCMFIPAVSLVFC